MTVPTPDDGKDSDAMPAGFTLIRSGLEEFTILHRRAGMGCMNIFLIVWFAGWTVGCVFLLFAYFSGGAMEGGEQIPAWFVAVFWAAEIAVAGLLAYLLFCKTTFRLGPQDLTIETDVLGLKWTRSIPKAAIRRLVQVKDGGEGEDSFPSWGLKIEGDMSKKLLFRQPYEASHWLGRMLADWAGVEFEEAPR